MNSWKKVMSLALAVIMIVNIAIPNIKVFAVDGKTQTEASQFTENGETAKPEEGGTEKEQPTEPAQENQTKEEVVPSEKTTEEGTTETEKVDEGEKKAESEEVISEESVPLGEPKPQEAEAKDITAKVTKSLPDVYIINEQNRKTYIIKDGQVVPNPPTVQENNRVEFFYNWEIKHENMAGLKEGDFFYINLPNLERVKFFGFKAGVKYPISSLDNPDEELGKFIIETEKDAEGIVIGGKAKLMLNQTAVKKHAVERGFLKLQFKAQYKMTIEPKPNGESVEAIVITPQIPNPGTSEVGNKPYYPNRPLIKGGQSYADSEGQGKTKLQWSVYVNYDQLTNAYFLNSLEAKQNVWLEDDMANKGMKVDEKNFRIYAPLNLALKADVTEAGKTFLKGSVSNRGFYWPSRRIKDEDFKKPNANESYEEFKARLKADTTLQPLTVAIYPRETGDSVLVYFGDLALDKGLSYSDLLLKGDLETEALKVLKEEYLDKNRITPEQFENTKKLYGFDDDKNTKMKKAIAYRVEFSTIQDKEGDYVNKAELKWNGDNAIGQHHLYYSLSSAGAGYNNITARTVEKKWERKDGNPVTMQLIDNTDSNNPIVVDTVKLGVPNPIEANKETDKWSYSFDNLPTHKKIKENGKDRYIDIIYDVKEVMDVADQGKYTENKAMDGIGFVFTNTNSEKIKFKVTKKWVEVADAPVEKVTFDVIEKDTQEKVLEKQTITKSEGWTKEFNLPKYNTKKNLAQYTVVEYGVSGFIGQPEDKSVGEGQETVLFNVPTRNIRVTKVWQGIVQSSAEVELLKDGQPTGKKLTLTSPEWSREFKALPKYEAESTGSREIQYTIKETPISGYTVKVEGGMENGYTVTNSQFVQVEAIKKWHTDRPIEEVQVELYYKGKNGEADTKVPNVNPQTIPATNGAKVVFENLPKYNKYNDKIEEIEYIVKEVTTPLGYQSMVIPTPNVSTPNTKSFTIINRELTEINVIKKWVGPAKEITLQLFRKTNDGAEEKVKEEKLSGGETDTAWNHTFSDLFAFDENGNRYTYRVDEIALPDYNKKVENTSTQNNKQFTITNTNTEKIVIKAKKVWVDDNNAVNKRPREITFVLTGVAGTEAGNTITYRATVNESNQVAGNADEWEVSFSDLPKYSPKNGKPFVYTLAELTVNGYNSVQSGDAKNGFVVTNTIKGKVSVAVTKEWAGAAKDSITVELYRNGSPLLDSDDNPVKKEITAKDGWQHTFTDLEQFDAKGKEYSYDIKEVKIDGYTSYKRIPKNMKNTFHLVNINEQKVNVRVQKNWVGPKKEAIVHLYADGVKRKDSITLNQANNWAGEFAGLRKYSTLTGEEIRYTVKEEPIENYKAEIIGGVENGFTIINTNTETISIPVAKKWLGNKEGKVTAVVIVLKQNGKEFKRLSLSGPNWEGSFTDLPKYDAQGAEYAYSVEEETVAGYSKEKTIDKGKHIFTNTELVDIPVNKIWYPANIAQKPQVTLELHNGKGKAAEVTLSGSEATPWHHVFENMPKYDANNELIVYTVKEVSLDGFFSKTIKNDNGSFTVRNIKKTEVPVTKKWIGAPVTDITAKLKKQGSDTVVASEKLNTNNGWKHTFGNLPLTEEDGSEITYIVEEEIPSGAPASQKNIIGNMTDGFVITNINNELIAIDATKVWYDTKASTRPAKITFVLTGEAVKDGEETDTVVIRKDLTIANLDASNPSQWKVRFDGLRKYSAKNGAEFVYRLTEEAISNYNHSIAGDASTGFTVSNTVHGKVTFSVTKKWIGKAATSVFVVLYRKIADGSEEQVLRHELKGTGNTWKHVFTDLDQYNANGKEYIYRLAEEPIAGYTMTNTVEATNSVYLKNVNDETTSVKVTKDWIGPKAKEVTAKLLADGKESASLALNEANKWTAEFKGLRKYDAQDGHVIVYEVKEVPIENYKSRVKGSADTGFVITNVNEERINIPVKKQWVNSSQNSVTVHLYAENTEMATIILSPSNNWEGVFRNYLKYSAVDGQPIQYSVREDNVPNYSTKITGDINGFVITNTYLPPIPPYIPEQPGVPGGDNPPTPTPPTPTPPTSDTEIPGEPIPEGNPTKPEPPAPPVPTVPEEEVPEEPIPQGAPELPKTSGIPASLFAIVGVGFAAVGAFLKKKSK